MGKKDRHKHDDSDNDDEWISNMKSKDKASIGKKIAEKSGGLFSPEDWMCKSCGNINWARRLQCNICNAAKFQKAEARTGAGGGYNEREGVEYKERQESDDEYDEFGRKKKKFRGKLAQTSVEDDTKSKSKVKSRNNDEDDSKYSDDDDKKSDKKPINDDEEI